MMTGELCGRGRSEQVWLFPPSQMQPCLSKIHLSPSTELTVLNLGYSESKEIKQPGKLFGSWHSVSLRGGEEAPPFCSD